MAINGQTVLAVIPARGCSKRVPRKNLREYRGLSLLLWAHRAAVQSKYLDMTFCSTEDSEIWRIAKQNAVACIQRPDELATDDATCEDVLRHSLSLHPADWVVLLQPTSPNRTAADIDACIERAQLGHGCISTYMGKTNGAVYVATAEWLAEHEFSHAGLCKFEMDESHSLDINLPEDFLK